MQLKRVQKYKPKFVVTKSLKDYNENGNIFDQDFFLSPTFLSFEHLALRSTSVSVQGRLLSGVCLSFALSCPVLLALLTPLSYAQHRLHKNKNAAAAAYGEAYQAKLSCFPPHHSLKSKAWIMRLCCPHICLISFQVFGIGVLFLFTDLDLKNLLLCF